MASPSTNMILLCVREQLTHDHACLRRVSRSGAIVNAVVEEGPGLSIETFTRILNERRRTPVEESGSSVCSTSTSIGCVYMNPNHCDDDDLTQSASYEATVSPPEVAAEQPANTAVAVSIERTALRFP